MDNLTHSCIWMEQKKTAATNGVEHYLKNNDFTKQFVFGLFLNEKILIFYYRQLDPFFVESYISWYFFKYRFFVSCK